MEELIPAILLLYLLYVWIAGTPVGAAIGFVFQNLYWIAPLIAALWVWHKYGNAIARWYYFTFHPHPAEHLVRYAIDSGVPLDGPALASALGEPPPASGILREVRLVQAERLVNEMQVVSRGRARELEKRAKAEYERAAAVGAQEAIALAATALERAKAALRASQMADGG
jgi:hypothetical protein